MVAGGDMMCKDVCDQRICTDTYLVQHDQTFFFVAVCVCEAMLGSMPDPIILLGAQLMEPPSRCSYTRSSAFLGVRFNLSCRDVVHLHLITSLCWGNGRKKASPISLVITPWLPHHLSSTTIKLSF